MRPRILVTRPEPGASRTAARLAAAGFEPVVLPLTRIAPLAHELPMGRFEAVIVTSAQALRSVRTDPILDLPIFAVGETTAESARTAGFQNITTAGGGISSIAGLVQQSTKPWARLLYLCGKVRRPELEAALADAGFHLAAVETYDAVPVTYSKTELAALLGRTAFDAVALMSAQAAAQFLALAQEQPFERLFKSSELVCFSQRIADSLGNAGHKQIIVTAEASEDALLELLSQRFLQS